MILVSRRTALSVSLATLAAGCARVAVPTGIAADHGVSFDPFEREFSDVVDSSVQPRLLSTGHRWAEGPAWDGERQRLYFTDVPGNRAFAWSQSSGVDVFLDPSGVEPERAQGMREPGANGLLLARSGGLLICNHGARAVELRDFRTGERRTLTGRFAGKKFNSPNDLIEADDGTIYFTDPPYGLSGLNASPMKELDVNGVYRLTPGGEVTRIVDDMTFPNGIVLSDDGRYLYVSQSDPDAPLIRRFTIGADGVGGGEVWFDARPFMADVGGLPDGMAVGAGGHIFLAGPGGVLVIDRKAKCLGRIATGRATANCAFGEDGKTLFITAADRLVAVRNKAPGLGRF
ncbi:MAG: SMP-30/gluconolactonase/LRE family protein [Pseudomonadota bacterium]